MNLKNFNVDAFISTIEKFAAQRKEQFELEVNFEVEDMKRAAKDLVDWGGNGVLEAFQKVLTHESVMFTAKIPAPEYAQQSDHDVSVRLHCGGPDIQLGYAKRSVFDNARLVLIVIPGAKP